MVAVQQVRRKKKCDVPSTNYIQNGIVNMALRGLNCHYTREVNEHLNFRSTEATTHACMHHTFYHTKSEYVLMGVDDCQNISLRSAHNLYFHSRENLQPNHESTGTLSNFDQICVPHIIMVL